MTTEVSFVLQTEEAMNRSVVIGVLLFVLGVLIGNSLPTRRVLAQEKSQEQQGDWVIDRAKDNAHFDAYIFNTRTGEAFFVQERSKTPVTLRP
jgi:hypothetical protein